MIAPKFKIAKDILCSYVLNKRFFKAKRLEEEIIKQGGLLRIDSCETVKGALENLTDMGLLRYNLEKDTYIPVKNVQNYYLSIKRR